MQTYEIKSADCSHADRVISKIGQQRAQLEETKALFEPYFQSAKADEFRGYMGLHDPFKFTRFLISDRYNTPSISVSWIKMIEILYYFGSFIKKDKNPIYVYDHAAIPGAGILAAAHYLCTMCPGQEWEWFGNMPSANPSADDTYKLYEEYRETNHWIGKSSNDYGGVKTLCDVCSDAGLEMNLFICDQGVDCGKQFHKQEELFLRTNFAQVAAAIGLLKEGGLMICKMFTFGTQASIWLLENLARIFDSLHICKPTSSRPNNAEMYVVGIGFKCEKNPTFYNKLMKILEEWNDLEIVPTCATEIFSQQSEYQYLKSIYQAFVKLCEVQTKTIKEELDLYERHKQDQRMLRHMVGERNKKIVEGWFSRINLKVLHQYDWLRVVNTTPYQPSKQAPMPRRW